MFEKAIKFLPKMSPRSLKNQDKQLALGDSGSIACNAVAISLNVNKRSSKALQMLEFDRGIIADSLLKMRIDIFELRQKHFFFANRFEFFKNHFDQSSITIDNVIPSTKKFE